MAMLATMPASLLIRNAPWCSGAAGTIWHGEVGVAGDSRLEWRVAPLRSLLGLGLAANWRAQGPKTDLSGQALLYPGGRVVLDQVGGGAAARLLDVIQPDLPFTCDLAMQVAMAKIALGGGERRFDGRVMTDPGSCRTKPDGAIHAVPALVLTTEPSGTRTRIRLTPATRRRQPLIDATLREDGMLDLELTAQGAATLPFIGLPGGTRIQGKM